jgi:hypothetical protein
MEEFFLQPRGRSWNMMKYESHISQKASSINGGMVVGITFTILQSASEINNLSALDIKLLITDYLSL